jgi:branched-chain amino acid transport system permease protein
MNYFMQQIINALGWGSILALLAAGYTMTFGIIGLVNFAYGEVFMAAAFAAYFALTIFNLPYWVALLVGLISAIVIGLAIEKIAFKPVRGAGMITLFITSLGASIIIRNLFVMLFDDSLKSFKAPNFLRGVYLLSDLIIFKKSMLIFLITIILCIVLVYIVKNTKLGIAMRSISYDSQIAETLGINTERIIIITFIIASFLGGIAGILWGILYGSVRASMGAIMVVDAFIASVVGGVGNVFGAMVSGYILAIGSALFIAYLPQELVGLKPLFVWIVFFIILIFKPSGLFRANIK